jgi:hypothetical protein
MRPPGRSSYGIRDMDPAPFVVIAVLAIAAFAIGNIVLQGQKRKEAWDQLAEQLGLRHEGGVLLGDLDDVPVRIAMEMHRKPRGYTQFCVVSAAVPGTLPRGFVAAPRVWTSGLDRMLAENVVPSEDPALKECYVFQSDRPQECAALIAEPAVEKALLELYGSQRVGFVEKGRVHIAYPSFVSDVEEARSALRDVVHAARTLATVQGRLSPDSGAPRVD